MALQACGPVYAAVQPDRLTQKPRAIIGAGVSQNSDLNFDVGLGASNPRLRYKVSDASLEMNKGILRLGTGAAANQILEFDIGAGASNPKVRYNNSLAKIQFSNDGTSFSDVGSDTGSASVNGGYNLLTNDDNYNLESATVWTASGGSFTAETGTPIFGAGSALFDASALNQTLSSPLKTVVEGLKSTECVGAVTYKYSGTDFDYSLQVYDGTTVLADYPLPQSTTVSEARTPGFYCPSSGSIRIRLIANVANPGVITLDGTKFSNGSVYLGAVFSEPTGVIGTWTEAGATNCLRQGNTGGAWDDMTADTDCSTPTVTGNRIAAHSTKIAGFDVAFLPKGIYKLTFTGMMRDDSASSCYWGLYDGTTREGLMGSRASSGSVIPALVGYFVYTTDQTNLVFQVQTYPPVSASDCTMQNGFSTQTQNKFILERMAQIP